MKRLVCSLELCNNVHNGSLIIVPGGWIDLDSGNVLKREREMYSQTTSLVPPKVDKTKSMVLVLSYYKLVI